MIPLPVHAFCVDAVAGNLTAANAASAAPNTSSLLVLSSQAMSGAGLSAQQLAELRRLELAARTFDNALRSDPLFLYVCLRVIQ